MRREARRREHATAAIRHCNHRVGRTIRPSPAAPSRSAIPFRSQYCNSPNNGACGGGSHIQVDSPTARAEASPHLDCAAPKEGARDRGRAFNGSRLHAPETLAWAATPGERKWWLMSPRVDLDWRLAWRFPRFCGRGGRGGWGRRKALCVCRHTSPPRPLLVWRPHDCHGCLVMCQSVERGHWSYAQAFADCARTLAATSMCTELL